MIRRLIRNVGYKTPLLATLLRERDAAKEALQLLWTQVGFQHGDFYSPIPTKSEIDSIENLAASLVHACPTGIDLNLSTQADWMSRIAKRYLEMPFPEYATETCRYCLDNDYFVYSDGITLFGMMRELKPNRIVEIGSGYSSAVMMETNERFFQNKIQLTFIEPFPENRLTKLIRPTDSCVVHAQKLQEVETAPWQDLAANDILFIDSSHVSKCSSDVNRIFFEVLPTIVPGVVVHIHDVFPGFEYPVNWLRGGIYWNEAYMLRAFLTCNNDFEILVWPSLMFHRSEVYGKSMPLSLKNTGSSFWMRRKPV